VAKLSFLTWLGNTAARFLGKHGAVTEQAQQADCSRQTVYDHARKVQQAVVEAQLPGPSRDELLHDNERLRAENQQLWDSLDSMVNFAEGRQQQFAATAAALGLSLSQTVVLLTIVLGKVCCPSRAKVGRWVQASSGRAARLLQVLDRACQALVRTLCLDEIFLRRQPVLMGVEPHSMTWVLGLRAKDRTGETWAAALTPWPQLSYSLVDGGTGLRRGLKLLAQQRREEKATVPLESNLDNFHIQQDGQKALRGEWQAAEVLWEKAERADRVVVEKSRRQGQNACAASTTARWAWQRAETAFRQAEQREQAYRRVVAALELFRADGTLNHRAAARADIVAALKQLPGPRWAKFGRMALDARSLTFLDRLQRHLEQAEPRTELRAALVKLWQARHPWWRKKFGGNLERDVALVAVRRRVCQLLDPAWEVAYERVSKVLRETVRASSVVECMNSVVRMHQARHRGLSQALVDLKRLYWNCRTFAEGKRKKHCPYEHLGVQLPTYDWWELLQMNPDELQQKLSSTKLAA
jgi:hypothetical protein